MIMSEIPDIDYSEEQTFPDLSWGKTDASIKYSNDLIIAFVAGIGVNIEPAEKAAEERLGDLGYEVSRVRVTKDILPSLDHRKTKHIQGDYAERTHHMMDVGNDARERCGVSIIADGIASVIVKLRSEKTASSSKNAYFVRSLKHPGEVQRLRALYGNAFFLIGIHASHDERLDYLINKRNLKKTQAEDLMVRDRKETVEHGQKLDETFHLADFFTGWQEARDDAIRAKHQQFLQTNINRFIDIIFGDPHITPTFDEHAMFMAFSAALRSADLSRQVGAVITRKHEILSAGSNDCPKASGGLYWPHLNPVTMRYEDAPKGRDRVRGEDPNRRTLENLKSKIADETKHLLNESLKLEPPLSVDEEKIVERVERLMVGVLNKSLERSGIDDLTEFGRAVHAEMDSLLSCARNGIPTIGTTMFCTTFPCHNCAKHIVAAGIVRVVFVEPYLKSQALLLHDDSIEMAYPSPLENTLGEKPTKVRFEPFVGIGPRRYFDLFSINMGTSSPRERKNGPIRATEWQPTTARIRIRTPEDSYRERELAAAAYFEKSKLTLKP